MNFAARYSQRLGVPVDHVRNHLRLSTVKGRLIRGFLGRLLIGVGLWPLSATEAACWYSILKAETPAELEQSVHQLHRYNLLSADPRHAIELSDKWHHCLRVLLGMRTSTVKVLILGREVFTSSVTDALNASGEDTPTKANSGGAHA
jgi:hypothetical protein